MTWHGQQMLPVRFGTVRDPAPPAQQVLYTFENAAALARWKIFSDQELGGTSTAELKDWPEHPVRSPQSHA